MNCRGSDSDIIDVGILQFCVSALPLVSGERPGAEKATFPNKTIKYSMPV